MNRILSKGLEEMLREMAFTPHIFEEETNADNDRWTEQLRLLGERLFPWSNPSPFMISNLYDGSWEYKVSEYIQQLSPEVRHIAQTLFTEIKKILVTQPAIRNWPGDSELEWANQATDLLEQEQIDCLVVSEKICNQLRNDGYDATALQEIENNVFWNNLIPDNSIPMVINEQVKKLKLICLHSQYIAISSAYIEGKSSDEASLIKGIMKAITHRPKHYTTNVCIDVHCELAARLSSEQKNNKKKNIEIYFKRIPSKNIKRIRIIFWNKVRERILLAGNIATRNGNERFKPRWGIHLGHIARGSENNMDDMTLWHLLTHRDINYWYKKLYQTNIIEEPIEISNGKQK